MPRRARVRLWTLWALRDARKRWLQVVSIAFLIALGTGMYSSMSSMSRWRVASADASYAALRMHDLRVSLADGSYARAGALKRALGSIPGRANVVAAEERLVIPTQVDASTGGRTILVPGRIVGMPARASVDSLAVDRGRLLRPGDSGRPVADLERNFAAHYELGGSGRLKLAGGRTLAWVGRVYAPEYFIVTAPGADFGAESSFAVVFTSLATAQSIAGRPGLVNELVLRAPGAGLAAVQAQLAAALRHDLPRVGVTFTRRADEPAHRLIYKDAENDQQMLDIFGFLLLGAAAFAAFNLVSRAIEAQRREIGIGMALGVPARALALRPMLLGLQIAVLGVGLGIPLGLEANAWLASVLRTWFPLPVLHTPLEPDLFVAGAALGLALPLAATALPVWRAVRVPPIEAIRVGARAARSSGLAWLVKDVRLPGGTLANMPLRNVLRTPRRTLLTAGGIAAVVAIVVSMSGVMDSFDATLGAARDEALAGSSQRMTVDLTAPQPASSATVRSVSASPAVGRAQRSLRLPARISAHDQRLNAFLEIVPRSGTLWHPTLRRGSLGGGGGGLVLADVAARDLHVGLGDRVAVRHPVPSGPGTFRFETTVLTVSGIHTSPFRFIAYAPADAAARLGVSGLVNRISVAPAPGRSADDVKRALLSVPGVAAVQGASATTDAVDKRMAQFDEILVVIVGIAMLMALLMAYNASAINTDERARENATMFAFGVRGPRVLRMGVVEALLTGLVGTALGGAAGYGLLRWMIGSSMRETMPDVGSLLAVRPLTVVFALLAGTVAVALAPLLTRRRVERIDIPSTLRVVE